MNQTPTQCLIKEVTLIHICDHQPGEEKNPPPSHSPSVAHSAEEIELKRKKKDTSFKAPLRNFFTLK